MSATAIESDGWDTNAIHWFCNVQNAGYTVGLFVWIYATLRKGYQFTGRIGCLILLAGCSFIGVFFSLDVETARRMPWLVYPGFLAIGAALALQNCAVTALSERWFDDGSRVLATTLMVSSAFVSGGLVPIPRPSPPTSRCAVRTACTDAPPWVASVAAAAANANTSAKN